MNKNIRVRTGCLTCRKRRVKCDEAKPKCKRCIKANVVCDGYQKQKSFSTQEPIATSPNPTSHDAIFLDPFLEPGPMLPPIWPDIEYMSPSYRSSRDRQGLAFYHHFVTQTALKLFDPDFVLFWRDRVASIAWEEEVIYEAIVSLGAVHQANQLALSHPTSSRRSQSLLLGLSSYGKALNLMSSYVTERSGHNLEMVIIAIVLFAYCECIMNHPKPALSHLQAAGQLLAPCGVAKMSPRADNLKAIEATLLRLDFLVQSIVPYAQSRIPKLSVDDYAAPLSANDDGRPTLLGERAALSDIISKYNNSGNVVWGPWSSGSLRPSAATLSSFQQDLLYWRDSSPLTFGSCTEYSDPRASPESCQLLDDLQIPPKALPFRSGLAAVNVALFNNYMACSYCLLSDGISMDQDARCAFGFVYQNLQIAENCTSNGNKYGPSEEHLDISISLLLYLGFRRCYSEAWQKWTIKKLRQCGRQGLLDGHAFANTLEHLSFLQIRSDSQRTLSCYGYSPLRSRILPLLMPKDDGDWIIAYYFKHAVVAEAESDAIIQVVGRASWKQDDSGNVMAVKYDMLQGFNPVGANILPAHYCNGLDHLPAVSLDVTERFNMSL